MTNINNTSPASNQKTPPTSGALRAAEAILDEHTVTRDVDKPDLVSPSVETLAEVIDLHFEIQAEHDAEAKPAQAPTAHTPGPWLINDGPNRMCDIIGGTHPDCGPVATVWLTRRFETPDRGDDNARLIAAAPAMKQRLERARHFLLCADFNGALTEIELGIAGEFEGSAA